MNRQRLLKARDLASKNESDRMTYLNPQEHEQVERFEVAYNAIDRHLRNILHRDPQTSFAQLIVDYFRKKKIGSTDYTDLRTFADLRNVLVHEKVKPKAYIAVPAPFVVEKIEEIRDRLIHPQRVLPKFQKSVESIKPDDSLAKVLALINDREYSQFPVYDANQFKGLLTENGITRWFAHHTSKVLSLIEVSDISVKQVLGEEERRSNYEFVPRSLTTIELTTLFAEREMLEAALITQSGNRKEKLMGIVTRWDVVQLRKELP